MSNSLQPHELQQARPPCPSPTPGAYSNPCLWSWWCHPAISSSVIPFSSQHQGLFQWVNSSYQVAKVLEFQLQYRSFQWTPRTDFLQDGMVGSPHSPRDSQESPPTPQFKSINSSVLSFLHSPTLTSIHSSCYFVLLQSPCSIYSELQSPGGSVVKNLPANAGDAGDTGSIPGLEISPGERNDNPLQYSCLGNPMDRGAWWATIHGVEKSQIWLKQLSTVALRSWNSLDPAAKWTLPLPILRRVTLGITQLLCVQFPSLQNGAPKDVLLHRIFED